MLILLLLSFKWPKLARVFYVAELVWQVMIFLLPYVEHKLQVSITFHYLFTNNLLLSVY